MKHLFVFAIILGTLLTSCNVKPEPINYNQDECAFCKMKISDIRFGAEMVTKKGKIHKYDSAECLVRTYLQNDPTDYAYILVTDYVNPHTLIDAETATFLISENQPSPMGANLSAYEQQIHAEAVQQEKGGTILSFQELLNEQKAMVK